MEPLQDDTLPSGIRGRFIEAVNGLQMHVQEAGYEAASFRRPMFSPLMMRWTAPTRRHLGAKVVVSMNHGETGAVHERSYHDGC